MISWVLWSQCVKSSATHDLRKATLVFFKKKKKNRSRRSHAKEVKYSQITRSHCLTAMKCATLLSEPMSLLTPQQSRTNGPSGQEMTSLDSSGSIFCETPLGVRDRYQGFWNGCVSRSRGVEGSAKGYIRFKEWHGRKCGWASPHQAPWALNQGFMPRVKRGGFVLQRATNPARV